MIHLCLRWHDSVIKSCKAIKEDKQDKNDKNTHYAQFADSSCKP